MIDFTTRHGTTLVADEAGRRGAPSVVFLHGGGQTRHSWGTAVSALGEAGFHAVSLDLRGHGDSFWSDDGDYRLEAHRDDLEDVVAALPDRPAIVGASLGGLAALLAVGEGTKARSLVLVDVVPRIEPEGAREIHAFMTARPDGFASLDEAADAVAAYQPHRERPSNIEGLRKNLRERGGRLHWHWDPRIVQDWRHNGPITFTQSMLEDAARTVTCPTLLIRGGRSRVVSAEGVEAFRALIPATEYVNIARADHMVAGDANDAFNAPLIDFLQRTRAA